ncbi:MAG TPA: ROK family protein [Prolixibacteraceae bacterium]|nr:ROK family protein [Prolixibacteraceae bacterium]
MAVNLVEQKNHSLKRKIIKHLFLYGTMAITDLVRYVKLSTPKIIGLLNELKSEGLVEELGQGSSSGGRRPNLYGNKEDAFCIVVISINLYKTSVYVFNARNQMLTEERILPLTISHGPSIIDPIVEFTESIISEMRISREKILGIGIEMPGLVDSHTGINKTYMISDLPVGQVFSRKFKLPVLIENDAKTRTFAELRFGAARSKRNVLVLHIDWGIGIGIIVNGKLYKGRDGFAGEFGHLPMVEHGLLCQCGKQGCLETVASGTAIARLVKEGIRSGRSSLPPEMAEMEPDKMDISTVVLAAARGDQYSISILAQVGHWLGKGLAMLIQIFNPEMIILGGQLSEAHPFILPPIHQSIQIFCNPDLGNEVQIKISELGAQSGIHGIAALVAEQVLDKN